MEEKIKLLPSGISDFKQLRRQNRYYVDKSMYIPTIETVAKFQFLIRPRRFGKSLFLTMLSAYYDLNERDNFQNLFKGLWIADHPTELQGQYQVLYTKMKKVIQLDKLDGNRRSILHQIAQDGFIYGEAEESFPAEHLYDPKMFISLLFYFGMLTMISTFLPF